jgi:hypothetical protein
MQYLVHMHTYMQRKHTCIHEYTECMHKYVNIQNAYIPTKCTFTQEHVRSHTCFCLEALRG